MMASFPRKFGLQVPKIQIPVFISFSHNFNCFLRFLLFLERVSPPDAFETRENSGLVAWVAGALILFFLFL